MAPACARGKATTHMLRWPLCPGRHVPGPTRRGLAPPRRSQPCRRIVAGDVRWITAYRWAELCWCAACACSDEAWDSTIAGDERPIAQRHDDDDDDDGPYETSARGDPARDDDVRQHSLEESLFNQEAGQPNRTQHPRPSSSDENPLRILTIPSYAGSILPAIHPARCQDAAPRCVYVPIRVLGVGKGRGR